MNWLRPFLLVLAAIFLGLGLFLPIIRFERLYFFSETPSLLELVAALFEEGDVALSLVVGLFSIVFPIVKLAGLAVQLSGRVRQAGFFGRAMPHLEVVDDGCDAGGDRRLRREEQRPGCCGLAAGPLVLRRLGHHRRGAAVAVPDRIRAELSRLSETERCRCVRGSGTFCFPVRAGTREFGVSDDIAECAWCAGRQGRDR